MQRFSLLDLSPIPEGENAAHALRCTVELAQAAEAAGYHRYWLAEHHNMPGIASAATAVVIGHVAGATSTLRVGAGGIMLPNHAPLMVAEAFGTLATLYPDRRAARVFFRVTGGHSAGDTGSGHAGSGLDSGFQSVRRTVGGAPGSALCVCLTLCAGHAGRRIGHLSHHLHTFCLPRHALRHGGSWRVRGGDR